MKLILHVGHATKVSKQGESDDADALSRLDDMVELAARAERAGFYGVSLAENSIVRDPFVVLTCMAQATERLKLFTAVTNPFTRTPITLARSIATVQEASKGRAVLGLGTGSSMVIGKEGIDFNHPASRVSESLDIIRKLLHEGEVTYSGKFFTVNKLKLGFPLPEWKIPVFTAPIGPRSLKIAGAKADGVLFTTPSFSRYLQDSIARIADAAREVGRKTSEVELVAPLMAAVAPTKREALEIFSSLLLNYLSLDGMEHLMNLSRAKEKAFAIRQSMARGDYAGATEMVDEEFASEFGVFGTMDDVVSGARSRFKEYEKLGISAIRVVTLGRKPKETLHRVVESLA